SLSVGPETWEYTGSTWSRVNVTTSPSARTGAAMIYDPGRAAVVLFGGGGPFIGLPVYGDTWTYNGTWTQLGGTPPATPRSGHAMTATPQGLLVFGGADANGPLTDLWLNGAPVTTAVHPTSPNFAANTMVEDPGRNRVVLARSLQWTAGVNVGDTWEFTNGNWQCTARTTEYAVGAWDTLRDVGVLVSPSGTVEYLPATNSWHPVGADGLTHRVD